jgi:hypothetical protein
VRRIRLTKSGFVKIFRRRRGRSKGRRSVRAHRVYLTEGRSLSAPSLDYNPSPSPLLTSSQWRELRILFEIRRS